MTSFDELLHLFGSAENLPHLPESPLELANLLEKSDPNPGDIERHILADPALTAGVFRAASSAFYGRGKAPTTIREATNLLGHRSLRALAIALWTNALTRTNIKTPHFRIDRFVGNANFVSNLSVTIAQSQSARGNWTTEELLAAGTLHNVLFALLAATAPEEFSRTYEFAQNGQITLDQSFTMLFSHPISDLAPRTAETLRLPPLFINAATAISQESEDKTVQSLQTAIIIAESIGNNLITWLNPITSIPIELSEDEITHLIAQTAARPDILVAA